ncbi:hypothetical protein LTR95_018156, partial [Oleoguttula sp. CCFEE 5521]
MEVVARYFAARIYGHCSAYGRTIAGFRRQRRSCRGHWASTRQQRNERLRGSCRRSNITQIVFFDYYSFEDHVALENVTGGHKFRGSNDTSTWSLEALRSHNFTIHPLVLVPMADNGGNGVLNARDTQHGWKVVLSKAWSRFKNLLRFNAKVVVYVLGEHHIAPTFDANSSCSNGVYEVPEGQMMPTIDSAGVGKPWELPGDASTNRNQVSEWVQQQQDVMEDYLEKTRQRPVPVQRRPLPPSDVKRFKPPPSLPRAEREAMRNKAWELDELDVKANTARQELVNMVKQTTRRLGHIEKAKGEVRGWRDALGRHERYMRDLKRGDAAKFGRELKALESERKMLETGLRDRELVASAFESRNARDQVRFKGLAREHDQIRDRMNDVQREVKTPTNKLAAASEREAIAMHERKLERALKESRKLEELVNERLKPQIRALRPVRGLVEATPEQMQRLENVGESVGKLLAADPTKVGSYHEWYKPRDSGLRRPPVRAGNVKTLPAHEKLDWLMDERFQIEEGGFLYLHEGPVEGHVGTHYKLPASAKPAPAGPAALDGAADGFEGAVTLFEHGAPTVAGTAPVTQLPKELLAGYRKGATASRTWFHKGDQYILDKAGKAFKAVASEGKQVFQGIKGGIPEGAIEMSDSIGALAPVTATEGAEAA